MKEYNCGKIPPCYGSLERAIYEEAKMVNDEWKKSRARHYKMIDKLRSKLMEGGFLDDTHDKVYGVNKQMCDIDKHLSEAGYFGMICEGQVEARKKLKDMEEKKTKKMTKAEAFEYLKGKKVNAKDKDRVVQMKMFDCGIKWRCGEPAYYNFGSHLFIDNEGFLSHCGNDEEYWKRHAYEEISADDILSMEIIDENKSEDELVEIVELGKKIQCLLSKLSGHRHVVITEYDVTLYDEGVCLFHSDPF